MSASDRPPPLDEKGPPEGASELLWGRHAVLEALKGTRPINKIWLSGTVEDERFKGTLRRVARERGAVVHEVDRSKLDTLVCGPHQGVVASLAAVAYTPFEAVVEEALTAPMPLLLLLDGIEDPHNLGALIRSAAAAGAQGVVIPSRRAIGLTGTVAKTAVGALEHVPVARVTNLVRAITALKEAGFWLVGADQRAPDCAYDADLSGRVAAVVGSEGRGLSRLVAQSCDRLVRFPMAGTIPSLNASVAGALLLFEIVRQRGQGQEA